MEDQYNTELDPVVNILRQSLEYKTSEINHRIDNIEMEIVNDILARSMPDYLSLPTPFMAMLQVNKKVIRKSEKDPLFNTEGSTFSFYYDTKEGVQKYDFLPLVNANIIKGHVSEIRKGLLENTWDIALDTEEYVNNLSGMTLSIKTDGFPIEKIEISCGEKSLPISMMSDYNQFPFSETIRHYMQYSGNEYMYKLLMNWHDKLCSKALPFCIVRPYDSMNIPLHREKDRIMLKLILNGSGKKREIAKEDVILNCIPVINAELHSDYVSEIRRPNLNEGKYILADDYSGNQFLKKRIYGTNRDGVSTNKEVYIVLNTYKDKDKRDRYQFIHYLASDVDIPITKKCELKSESSEFSSAIVVETFPCEKQTSETLQLKSLYHLQTHDRIVTPSDILSFCKTQLVTLMGYEESQIKSMEWNRTECKAEILIEGKKEIDEDDIKSQTAALKAMITKRTSMLTPVDIHITYSCTKR